MIVSHSKKFVFVKTAKTAGSSLEVFLSRFCSDSDVVTPLSPPEPGHKPRNYNGIFNPMPEIIRGKMGTLQMTFRCLRQRVRFFSHLPARNARCRIGPSFWGSYFTFCVERNPWDKTLSHYHMMNAVRGGGLTLEAYLHKGVFCTNFQLYTDWDNQTVIVDRVLRFENLNSELGEVCECLGIPYSGTLQETSKRGYRTDRRPYREVFSPTQAKRIERAFEPEIALHGYSF